MKIGMNYFFAEKIAGATLSGQTVQVNGTSPQRQTNPHCQR